MPMTGFFDRCTDKFEVSSSFLAMAEVDFWCKSCLSYSDPIKPREKPPFLLGSLVSSETHNLQRVFSPERESLI